MNRMDRSYGNGLPVCVITRTREKKRNSTDRICQMSGDEVGIGKGGMEHDTYLNEQGRGVI